MKNISNENRLLLYCAQLELTENMRNDLASLVRKPIAWDAFLEAVRWHGVASLAFNNLKAIAERHLIPAVIIENLKSDYRKNLVRNTILFAELDRILEAFDKHGIQVMPLKGAAFARKIYRDIGLRPMADIDILVKRPNVRRAEKIVCELGYRPDMAHDLDQLLKYFHHIKYINDDIKVPLEIHWAVTSPNHPDLIRAVDSKLIDKWWRRALPYTLEFQNILQLKPADRIYLIAAHFLRHRYINQKKVFNSRGALIQLCDIYNVTNYHKNEIDWEKLRVESGRIGLYKIVSVTLSIVKNLFARQNDHSMDFLNDWKFDDLDQEVIKLVTKRLFMREDKLAPIPFALIKLQTEKSRPRRFKDIFKAIFPNPTLLSEKLDRPIRSKAFYLTYLARPFILLNKHGKAFLEMRRLKEEGVLKKWIDNQD